MSYRGFKITSRTVRVNGFKATEIRIDGFLFGREIGKTRDDMLSGVKSYIDDSINRPDAYAWSRQAQLSR